MIPILAKARPQAGLMIKHRTPDVSPDSQDQENSDSEGLEACAQDIMMALESKDPKALAAALRAAYEICDSGSDSEDSKDNSYDAQNEAAAEGIE